MKRWSYQVCCDAYLQTPCFICIPTSDDQGWTFPGFVCERVMELVSDDEYSEIEGPEDDDDGSDVEADMGVE